MVKNKLESCPVFIGGEWREISDLETSPVYNPSRGEVIAEVPMCGAECGQRSRRSCGRGISRLARDAAG